MNRFFRALPAAGLGLLTALTLSAAPAPVPAPTNVVVKDRATFVPQRKQEQMPGKVVGVLVSDVVAVMGHDGRGGPPDAMGFSRNGNSYRWIYVPVEKQDAIITNLNVQVGEKGGRTRQYPLLNMANARTVKKFDIGVPYALVEVEVNDGDGTPPEEGFVATKMTRIDGSKDFPLDLVKVVAESRKLYAAWKDQQKTKLDDAMMEAQKKAVKNGKPTGPRETSELFYITWMEKEQKLSVRFRTVVTDGEYKYTEGGAGLDRDNFPLPPPPPPRRKLPPPPQAPQADRAFAAFPPPPPIRERVRYGTSFGIEYGVAFEFNVAGKLDRTLTLPAEPFVRELPPPPGGGFGPRRPIDPLPPDRKR